MMFSVCLYLLKSCAYVTAFYVPFSLVLRRTTFFATNRIYLVMGLLLSFALPLYTGLVAIPSYSPPDFISIEPMVVRTESVTAIENHPTNSLDVISLVFVFYLLGVITRLIMLTFSINRILKLKRDGEIKSYGNIGVISTEITIPFSFFNYVFLPNDLKDIGVFAHESAHVRQLHWVDLWLMELGSVILWFNPIMILYKRSLKQQHEYLADRSAITRVNLKDYLLSIRQHINRSFSHELISEFYFRSIKNRINMLTKKRTPKYGLAAYVIALPSIICLLMAFSPRKSIQVLAEIVSPQQEISLGLPIDKSNGFSFTSGYGERMHPVLKKMRMHTGIDLMAEEGVPVMATEEGVVVKAELAHAWGNIIVIRHDDKYSTSYSHLKSMNVKEGDSVQKGQLIGLVGHTGLSDKDHLHFELLENGKAIDPSKYLLLDK